MTVRGIREERARKNLVIAANRFVENRADAKALGEICEILARGQLPREDVFRILNGKDGNKKKGEQNASI